MNGLTQYNKGLISIIHLRFLSGTVQKIMFG